MHSALLALYHRAPAPLKSAAATTRGLYLRSWRYGSETDRLAAEARERESLSPESWKALTDESLARLLRRAATRVPFYREHFAARRRRGERPDVERLESWPVLTKETVRARTLELLADDLDPRALWRERTSGTTGTPLEVFMTKATLRQWYALFEARVREWNGVSRLDAWANVGGQLVAPWRARRPPFWVWNAGLSQLYMSSYHLAPGRGAAYVEALARHRVAYLHGYASSLESLALLGKEEGAAPPPLRVALSNAEPLLRAPAPADRGFFGCPVRDTYGMAELAAAASECEASRLHVWPEVGVIEVLGDGGEEPSAQRGDGAHRRDVAPESRHAPRPVRVGDRGALGSGACPCGRSLPSWRPRGARRRRRRHAGGNPDRSARPGLQGGAPDT
jgi:phenylacetate-CoA ligase